MLNIAAVQPAHDEEKNVQATQLVLNIHASRHAPADPHDPRSTPPVHVAVPVALVPSLVDQMAVPSAGIGGTRLVSLASVKTMRPTLVAEPTSSSHHSSARALPETKGGARASAAPSTAALAPAVPVATLLEDAVPETRRPAVETTDISVSAMGPDTFVPEFTYRIYRGAGGGGAPVPRDVNE